VTNETDRREQSQHLHEQEISQLNEKMLLLIEQVRLKRFDRERTAFALQNGSLQDELELCRRQLIEKQTMIESMMKVR
jgi:hypothetical protein